MARKPAITGLHSQGIVDDIIVPLARKVLKGATQKKATSALAKNAYKKANKAGDKLDKSMATAHQSGGFFAPNQKKNIDLTSKAIRKNLKKNISQSDLGNAIIAGKPTRGVVKNSKKTAPRSVPNKFRGM